MPSTSLLCYVPTSSTIFRRPSNSNEYYIYSPRTFKFNSLKFEDIKGLTGQPIYSSRFGMEICWLLKRCIIRRKTFAVESVVAQWADPEDKIQKAIQSCAVDCIRMFLSIYLMVEKSDQDSLELLMSKQLRALLRMSTGNSVGACVSNIFVDKKFQSRFYEGKHKASDTIFKTLLLIAGKTTQPYTNKLRDAVEVRRKTRNNVPPTTNKVNSRTEFSTRQACMIWTSRYESIQNSF
ncbi:hypothetical protein MKW94_017141 [Papaver nudicaule]|uniref:Uncharacterized protein n=1 Tax=Papaver nudicaule TaxID=74823 RepID=A0AA41RPL3_PAPNU|nr:hypothetical protein [Papaver nudicaule]